MLLSISVTIISCNLNELFVPFGVSFSLKLLMFTYKVQEGKQINGHSV